MACDDYDDYDCDDDAPEPWEPSGPHVKRLHAALAQASLTEARERIAELEEQLAQAVEQCGNGLTEIMKLGRELDLAKICKQDRIDWMACAQDACVRRVRANPADGEAALAALLDTLNLDEVREVLGPYSLNLPNNTPNPAETQGNGAEESTQ